MVRQPKIACSGNCCDQWAWSVFVSHLLQLLAGGRVQHICYASTAEPGIHTARLHEACIMQCTAEASSMAHLQACCGS
jgi:hypothetical protein